MKRSTTHPLTTTFVRFTLRPRLLSLIPVIMGSLFIACDDEIVTGDEARVRDASPMGGEPNEMSVGGYPYGGDEVIDRGVAGETAGETSGELLDEGVAGDLADPCSPENIGEVTCNGTRQVSRCEDEGWVIEDCPPGAVCDEALGECVEERCEEGVTICEDLTSVRVCVDGAFSEPSACADGEQCIAGRCISACARAAANADYQGCEFWAIDMDNIVDGEGEGPGAASSAVVLSNVSERAAQVTIEDREGVVVHQRQLEAGATDSFMLPRADLIGSQLGGTAWRVETTEPVLGYLFTPLQRTATSSVDATLLIPVHALDDRYRVLTWPGQGYNQRGTMSVIAVDEEPTTVTVVLPEEAAPGVDFRGEMSSEEARSFSLTPTEPWTEVLERGEVWHLQSGPLTDLSGAEVIADKDVVLFAGTRCSNIPAGIPRCDHLEHQMLPLRNQGRNYIAPGGLPRADEQTWYRVVATLDDTTVSSVPARPEAAATLDAGEVLTFSSSEPLALIASAPVMVGMFLASAEAGAGGAGDPSFVLLPPVEQFQSSYAFLTPDDFERDGLTIISNGEAALTLDGEALAPEWIAIADSEWRVAHLEITDGPHTISSNREFGMITTGYDEEVSYAFTGGLSLTKLSESEPPAFEGVCMGGTAINTPCETGLSGVCGAGRLQCAPGAEPTCVAVTAPRDERCDQRDDDCDGLVDEAMCAQFGLTRAAPAQDRLTLTEGEEAVFTVQAQGDAVGLEVEWSVNGEVFKGETNTTLTWTPLGFEEGPRTVKAIARDRLGERVAEVTWLALVNDAPSNTAVIWGKVTLPNGDTVPELTIELDNGPSEGEAVVDPRGYYAIPAESGRYDLKLDTLFNDRPTGYPRGIITLAEELDLGQLNTRRDIALPIAEVTGLVSTSDGAPLAEVELEFDGDCFACSNRAITGADGRYTTLLFYSTWSVDATPPAELGLPTRTVSDEEVNADRAWDVVFPSVYRVDALIVDQYGAPTPGVTIVIEGADAQVEQSTDASGRIDVNLPRGDYLVKLDTLFFPRPPNIGRGIITLIETLEVTEDIIDLRIPLPNAWVTGVITGQGDNQPQAGVTVDLDGSCFACSGRAVTDASGVYGVPLLHADYTIELTPPEGSAYVNQSSPEIAVYADLTHDMTLEGPALIIDGTLLDPRGDTVEGVGIKSEGRTESRVTTDAQGRFQLRLLPGDYDLKIDTLFGDRPDWAPRGIVDLWSGAVQSDITATYTAPFAWITGRVQESAGDVVPNAELDFDGDCFACTQTATSGADGRYAATIFQGVYDVEVTPPAPLPQQTLEDIDCTEVDVSLDVDY